MKKKIIFSTLCILPLMASMAMMANTSLPSTNMVFSSTTKTSPTWEINPDLFNARGEAVYSVNNSTDLLIRDKKPESERDIPFWKKFIVDHKDELLLNIAPDFSIASFNLRIIDASNANGFIILEISTATADVVGNLKIVGFMPRPQLPNYVANDPKYQYVDGNIMPIKNLGSLLTTTCYVDAQTLHRNWYPYDFVNAMLYDDATLYHQLQDTVIKNFLYNPNNRLEDNSQISISLPNATPTNISEYYETGEFPTLNNAVTGNEPSGTSQFVFKVLLENVQVNGKHQDTYAYSINLFNANHITCEAFNAKNLTTDLGTLNKDLIGDSLDRFNLNELLEQLGRTIDEKQDRDLPAVKLTLHPGTNLIKNISDGTLIINVDIENIVLNNIAKPFGTLKNVPWTVTGFKAASGEVLPDTLTTAFNSGHIMEYSASIDEKISRKLLEDVTIADLTNVIKTKDIKGMFINLPVDFNDKSNVYIIDTLEYDTKKGELKVYFSLTYGKINNLDVQNPRGIGIGGYFIIKDFTKPIQFKELSHEINLPVSPTGNNVYQYDAIDAIRNHLLVYLNTTANCFPTSMKKKLIDILDNVDYFKSIVQVISTKTLVQDANKTSPKQLVSVNIPLFSEITNTDVFISTTGFLFTITGFDRYEETIVTLDQTSFLNYSYEEFKAEVEKGNVGINVSQNNLANVTNLPSDAPVQLSISQLHSQGSNDKAIVSVLFPEFYSSEGLVKNYVYNIVVALHPSTLVTPYEDTFTSVINVRNFDRISGENWSSMTAPVAAQYFNNPSNKSFITNILNNATIKRMLFAKTPDAHDIAFGQCNVKSNTANSILLTIWSTPKNKQTITIEGFRNISGVTVVKSHIPSGTNVDTLLDDFHVLSGAALDKKAKQFLTLTNPVSDYVVKAVDVMGVATDFNNPSKKEVIMSFTLSDIYLKKDTIAYTIGHDYIFQFQYTVNGTSGGEGTLLSVNGTKVSETYHSTTYLYYLIPILVLTLIIIVSAIILIKKHRR